MKEKQNMSVACTSDYISKTTTKQQQQQRGQKVIISKPKNTMLCCCCFYSYVHFMFVCMGNFNQPTKSNNSNNNNDETQTSSQIRKMFIKKGRRKKISTKRYQAKRYYSLTHAQLYNPHRHHICMYVPQTVNNRTKSTDFIVEYNHMSVCVLHSPPVIVQWFTTKPFPSCFCCSLFVSFHKTPKERIIINNIQVLLNRCRDL